MTKLFISQPMRGRRMADIVRERKTLVADAAVALPNLPSMVTLGTVPPSADR